MFFWQFIFRAIIATVAAIHGHMTSKMGVVTKGHVYLLILTLKDKRSRLNGDMELSCFIADLCLNIPEDKVQFPIMAKM